MKPSVVKSAGLAVVLIASLAESPIARMSAQNSPQPPYPQAMISNGQIRATVYLPDPQKGFYRSTRFDWSGVIADLEYRGHRFYGPWFSKTDPPVRDFIYKGNDIITGAQSSMVGPAEEFQPAQGYAAAKPGGTFVKIGVGVLRRADESNYSGYANYEIVDPGKWTVRPTADAVEFSQDVNDPVSGYGYIYRKTVRLTAGRPELVIDHSLQNIGRLPIQARQYNHNFLIIDGAPTSEGYTITVPFDIQTPKPPDPALAVIQKNQIVYKKTLAGEDRVTFQVQGFGPEAKDYDVTVENTKTGAGVRVTADRPLASMALWSIRSVISMEPFVDVSTEPGATRTWKYTYAYFAK